MLSSDRELLGKIRSHLEEMGASRIETDPNNILVQFRTGSSLYKVSIFLKDRSLVCETPFYKTKTISIPAQAQEFLLEQNGTGYLQYAIVKGDGNSRIATASATLPPGSTSPYELKRALDEIHHAYQTTILVFKSLIEKLNV